MPEDKWAKENNRVKHGNSPNLRQLLQQKLARAKDRIAREERIKNEKIRDKERLAKKNAK